MMYPFHSNLPRRVWQSPSFSKPPSPGKKPSSLPPSSAFSAGAPRKVTVCRHASRETVPASAVYSESVLQIHLQGTPSICRNPDGWSTGRPSQTSLTGSYRRSSTSLRLLIYPASASLYCCRHPIRVSLILSRTRSCRPLTLRGAAPFFSRYVHYLTHGSCTARLIAR